jgi:peptidoglycan/LPS O-acetylase OafA/YrhL
MTPTPPAIETGRDPVTSALRNRAAAFSSSARIPALDGIRGVAILLVLIYHAVYKLNTGPGPLKHALAAGSLTWSGVDLFFVLSGFLIGGILLDARDSPNYFKTFYIRRAYRILPLYAAIVAVFSIRYVPSNWMPHGLGTFSQVPASLELAYLTFTQNIWMALHGTFGVGTITPTWSLAVEEQFYLTAPLLVRKIGRSQLVYVLVAVVTGAPLLRMLILWNFKYGHFANYVLMPTRADALSLGILAVLMVRSPTSLNWLVTNRSILYATASVLFIGLVWLIYQGYQLDSGPMVTFGYSILALFYACFLLIAVTHVDGRIHRWLCTKWLMRLGVVAYFMYLVHTQLIEVFRRTLGLWFSPTDVATQFWGGVIGILVTLALANLSWNYFEKPLLRRGHVYRY